MNNSIKCRTSKEVKIQLKRAEVKKNILVKNIYKQYEIYFQIVRKSILTSVEKGISGLYDNLWIKDKVLNANELNNFLNKKISFLIHSQLPLITIEQLKLGEIGSCSNRLIDVDALKELVEFKKFQVIDFDYESNSITQEPSEFHCNNYSNTYEYYESIGEDTLSSVNLDETKNFYSFAKQNITKEILHKKDIDSFLKLLEEIDDNKLFEYENINDFSSDVYISVDNLSTFDIIDKSFSHLLLNLSYKINSELFKINLINKIISEDTFKCLFNSNYTIKNPNPFVIKYDLNQNNVFPYNKSSDLYLFYLSNVELEFYNLDLSICRNKINELKNKFRLLNKKHIYWKNKGLILNN